MNRTIIKTLFLLALLAFPIGKVIAGISVTPAFIRLSETYQNTTYNIPVTITNQSAKKSEHFLVNFEAPQKIINGIPAAKVLKWVKVKPSKVSLQPGESRKVLATVKVPKGYVGDYRIYLSFMQDPKKYELQLKRKKFQTKVGMMQLGKTSTRLPEFKTHIRALLKVNVPIVLRALKPGQKPKLRSRDISISKFSLSPSTLKTSAVTMTAKVKNKSRYDVIFKGGCTVLNKKGTKKLMRDTLEQGLLLQPKAIADVSCQFKSPLPRGRYQGQGEFTAQIKGSKKSFRVAKRNKLKVDKNLANQIAGKGSIGGDDKLITPLLLSDNIIQQELFNGKARKVTIEVTNPTSKKMSVKASFKLSNDARVKAVFKPKRLNLRSGESKRVVIDFKSKDKKKPIYGFVNFTSKQAKGAPPVSIPVVMVPDGMKQKQIATFSPITAELTSGGTQVLLKTKIVNGKSGKDALYLNVNVSASNIESGILATNKSGILSIDHSIPGKSVDVMANIDFNKLPDGVYKITFKGSSDEGGLSIGRDVNLVVNRDIANKISLINQ